MHKIYHNNKNQGNSFINFKDTMLEICKKHKEEQRALSFAFILWDFGDAQVSKVLQDKAYWMALDKIAGTHLTVFSFHYVPEETEHVMGFMTSIPTHFSPSESSNKLIEKYFGNIDVSYPAILFFQVDDEKVVDSFLVSIKEDYVEDSYLEIKSLFESATKALQKITTKNKNNHAEIFECLRTEVKSHLKFKLVKRVSKAANDLLSLIATIKSL